MKLSIEEKARAYDEALERARKWYSVNTNEGYRGIFEDIFPELKESEDEKIRKIIRGWIYTRPDSFFDNGISKEEILAWLEKQGEQKPQRMVSAEAKEALYDKPKWTEEDDYNVRCCIARVESDIVNGCPERNKELIDWLESLKQRME